MALMNMVRFGESIMAVMVSHGSGVVIFCDVQVQDFSVNKILYSVNIANE